MWICSPIGPDLPALSPGFVMWMEDDGGRRVGGRGALQNREGAQALQSSGSPGSLADPVLASDLR